MTNTTDMTTITIMVMEEDKMPLKFLQKRVPKFGALFFCKMIKKANSSKLNYRNPAILILRFNKPPVLCFA